MLKLRAGNDAFQYGSFEVISSPEDDCFIYIRSVDGEKWVVICNFENEKTIETPFDCEPPVLTNLGRSTVSGEYLPYECAVSKLKCD